MNSFIVPRDLLGNLATGKSCQTNVKLGDELGQADARTSQYGGTWIRRYERSDGVTSITAFK